MSAATSLLMKITKSLNQSMLLFKFRAGFHGKISKCCTAIKYSMYMGKKVCFPKIDQGTNIVDKRVSKKPSIVRSK